LAKVTHKMLCSSFASDTEHLVGDTHRFGIAKGDMLKERVDGCKPSIARADAYQKILISILMQRDLLSKVRSGLSYFSARLAGFKPEVLNIIPLQPSGVLVATTASGVQPWGHDPKTSLSHLSKVV